MSLFSLLPLAAILASIAVLAVALRHRQAPGAGPFLGLVVSIAAYSLGSFFEMRATALADRIFWDNTQFFPEDMAVAFFFVLALRLARGRPSRLLVAALLIEPAANLVVVWLLPDSGWVRSNPHVLSSGGASYLAYSYGPWMWITIAYSYLLMLGATLLFAWHAVTGGRLERRQATILLLAALIPWIGTLLTITGSVPYEIRALDITPLTLTGANLLISIGLFRFRLLSLVPVARANVIEAMDTGMLVVRAGDLSLLDWNPAARRLLYPFWRGEWKPGVLLVRAMPEVAAVSSAATLELKEAAGERALHVRTSRINDEKGEARCLVLMIEDVSDMLQMQRRLELARNEAEQANAARTRFLANLSHEIRNPMGAVLSLSELLGAEEMSAEAARLLRLLQSQGASLHRLLEDLLDLSRMEAGRIAIKREPFDLEDLVRNMTDTFELLAAGRSLVLHTRVDAALPRLVLGDPVRLTQVLVNLLTNALKFTDSGSIWLQVRGDIVDRAGSGASVAAEFIVEDSGPGIPPEMLELIFQPFEQVSRTAERMGGAGLGLAISRQLVELMGGDIVAENRPTGGARFRVAVELPVAGESPATGDTSMPKPGLTPGLRLLVADDDAVNRALLDVLLRGSGVVLNLASDGLEAVERFRSGEYDLVLLDLQMPRLGGYGAAATMRRLEAQRGKGHRTPILAMTAFSMEGESDRMTQAGMDSYLMKPFNRETLLATVGLWTAPGQSTPAGPASF